MSDNNYILFPHVFPDIEKWPIYILSKDRKNFVKEIDEFTRLRLMKNDPEAIREMIATTIYQERIRIKEEPWKVDPPNERQFWNRIRKKLVEVQPTHSQETSVTQYEDILQRIIHRYSEEIVGTFNKSTFLFARKFLTFFFNRLLNSAAGRNFRRIFGSRFQLYERLKVFGDFDTIRNLFHKGVVVVVPTHSSNLDSILIGYMMDAIMGFPSFSYGAGLNLYNSGIPAYYMNRLGAYRVDRRKKNPIYLETLKAMSNLSMQRGTNSLFFPGGTRSRSGSIENKLKMGLLGTVVEAQRALCQQGKKQKIFIVPLVVSYHFVLEANYLIEQHLRITGKERYIKGKDESTSIRELFKFAWQLFSQNSDIFFSFGKPFDIMGNFVDKEGDSFDKNGNRIDIGDYFTSYGQIREDLQKEAEYTKMLSEKVVDRFHRENIVLSSHMVAFTAFNMLLHQNEKLDLYELLRLPSDDFIFPIRHFTAAIDHLKKVLIDFEKQGILKLSEQIKWDTDKLIRDGVMHLGVYHIKKPLSFNKDGDIISDDLNVLYFYHNRLENYGLSKKIRWDQFLLKEEDELEG